MSKEELSELLHSLRIPINEGTVSEENTGKFPRVIYWPFVEKDEMASGTEYHNAVTYQISFYARTPRHQKYKELRQMLRKKGIHPTYYHEYLENDPFYSKCWHTYFALDVIEDV